MINFMNCTSIKSKMIDRTFKIYFNSKEQIMKTTIDKTSRPKTILIVIGVLSGYI